MISIHSTKQEDITLILEYLQKFSHHQSYLKHAGGIVVSTFAGQESFFGFDSLNEAWVYVKQTIEKSISRPVQFIPSFFIDPRTYPSLSCMNGYFHWNGGWPIHLKPQSPHHEIHFPSLDSDQAHLCHLGRRTYMAAISPWFFTHYGKDSWNKNWIYRGDDHLLIRRWEYLLSIRDQVDIVQVVSWNDYGESHYISPVRGAQPNSQSWVDDCPHNSWLSINHLFIHAFKNVGAYEKTEEMTGLFHSIPHGIFTNAGMTDMSDIIWLWSRPHSKYATARNDSVGKPDNWELVSARSVTGADIEHLLTRNSFGEFSIPGSDGRFVLGGDTNLLTESHNTEVINWRIRPPSHDLSDTSFAWSS
ncbi:hypothetical protein QCA50_005397 [Cerrena zonata]|uniref:Glycoside hydrolase family 71 protein n=1 Tax=Cerrena zonata TaxID=2478898 RepID=A0AAW0GQ14_9APHY